MCIFKTPEFTLFSVAVYQSDRGTKPKHFLCHYFQYLDSELTIISKLSQKETHMFINIFHKRFHTMLSDRGESSFFFV